MNPYVTVAEEAVGHTQAITASVQARATGIGDGFITLNAQGKIGLDKFIGYVGKAWPQRMPVGAITGRSPWNAAEANLKQLEPFTIFLRPRVVSREKQVR